MKWVHENLSAVVLIGVWIATVAFFVGTVLTVVNQSEERLRSDFRAFETEIKADFKALRTELKADFSDLRQRVDTVIEQHGERLAKLEATRQKP